MEQLFDTAAEHEQTVSALQSDVDALQHRATAAEKEVAEVASASANKGGRPRGHSGRSELEARWETMSTSARRSALSRHASDIKDALLDANCEDWLPSCLALALQSIGLMDELLRTKPVALEQFKLVEELAALLQAEWSVDLSLFVRSELNLSDADYDRLRLTFCKKYVASKSRWERRLWYQCPVLSKTVFIPEPLLSRYKLDTALRSYSAKRGLALSFDSKVCERSLLEAATKLIDRDRNLLTDPARSLWTLTFGVDATAISSKRRYFTHALLSIAGMYQRNKATLSELKALTLTIAQHKDDATGLPKMLHSKLSVTGHEGRNVTCLAAEIEQLYSNPVLALLDGSLVRCGVRCCLDLAAVRGMRGVRGKGAAL
eukprot:6183023-Pleurochrysis_carterae.AAC.1